jgi:hypothetical protein
VNEVIHAAAQLQAVCEEHSWRFCFIGGLAQLRWGEPRETKDADLTLLTSFGREREFVQILLGRFEGRISDAESFALSRRVLLLRSASGVGLDVSLGGLQFEELVVDRSSLFEYPGSITLRTCSAEDLLILKAFAARTQDWADIERLIVRQTGNLDWSYIDEQLEPLVELKGDPEILVELKRRRAEYEK